MAVPGSGVDSAPVAGVAAVAPVAPVAPVAAGGGTARAGRLRLAVRALRRADRCATRSKAASLSEYGERWRAQLSARHSTAPRRLAPHEAMRLSSYGDTVLDALVDSAVVRVPAADFFQWRGLWLADLLRRVAGRAGTLVDLGAGAGKNLPAQVLAGFDRIVAVEPTSAGCAALADLGRRLDAPLHVVRGELPYLPIRLTGRAVIFTNHVLEQLPGRLDACLDEIIRLGDVRVVSIEPSWHPGSLLRHPAAELVDAAYRYRRRYASGLSLNLMRRQARGEITVIEHRTCGFSPRVVNVPTLAVWVPRA